MRGKWIRTAAHNKANGERMKRYYASGAIHPNKGKKLTDEQRAKISATVRSLWNDSAYRRNMVQAHQGKPMHPQTRRALLLAVTGRKFSTQHRHRISLANTGRKATPEHCRAIGDSKRGVLSPRWKGGISVGENKKQYKRLKTLERIARKKGASGTHTIEEWNDLKRKYDHMCLCCKQFEPTVRLTADHIIPLSLGGSNSIENIQPLCKSCNSRKWAKIIDYRPHNIATV